MSIDFISCLGVFLFCLLVFVDDACFFSCRAVLLLFSCECAVKVCALIFLLPFCSRLLVPSCVSVDQTSDHWSDLLLLVSSCSPVVAFSNLLLIPFLEPTLLSPLSFFDPFHLLFL
eukprot:m.6641 g.6641  ORF g.6641 m.6641 type:complete len:116 (-) comp8161_c0_seq1:32-379(-)